MLVRFYYVHHCKDCLKPSVRDIFSSEFATAKLWLRQDLEVITKECLLFGISPEVWSAVMFPHMMIYALLKDNLYNEDDRNLYIIGGAVTADVEAGPYHIRPSTAEILEADWLAYQRENPVPIVLFEEYYEDITEERRMRIERLNKRLWQIRYGCIYLTLLKWRFPEYELNSIEEEIQFFASGISLAPSPDLDRIIKGFDGIWFPFGLGNKGNVCSFFDVSMEYYNDLVRK